MSKRVQDIIPDLVLLPPPYVEGEPASLRGWKNQDQEYFSRLHCNRCIITLKELYHGHFTDRVLEAEPWGTTTVFMNVRGQVSSTVVRMLRIHREDMLSADLPTVEVSMQRLLGSSIFQTKSAIKIASFLNQDQDLRSAMEIQEEHVGPGLLSPTPPSTRVEEPPKKGALCPLVVEEVDLPPVGTVPIPCGQFCPRAKELFSNIERVMLEDPEMAACRARDMPTHSDPALKDRRTRVRLAARMWKSGMLFQTNKTCCTIDVFTVVKKVIPSPDGTFRISSRLTFEGR